MARPKAPHLSPDLLARQADLLAAEGYDISTLGQGVDYLEPQPQTTPADPLDIRAPLDITVVFDQEQAHISLGRHKNVAPYMRFGQANPSVRSDPVERQWIITARRELSWQVLAAPHGSFLRRKLYAEFLERAGCPVPPKALAGALRYWWKEKLQIFGHPLIVTAESAGRLIVARNTSLRIKAVREWDETD